MGILPGEAPFEKTKKTRKETKTDYQSIILHRKEISCYTRVELTHEAVSGTKNTTKMPAFRPLENKAMITMLVKQKETESMARVGLDQTRLAQRSFLFLSKRKPVTSTSTLPQRLLRNLEDEQYVIPLWTGFFYNVSNDSNNFHQVVYLPMIADSPTKYSIIYEMLIQTKQKAESLNLEVQPPPIISSY